MRRLQLLWPLLFVFSAQAADRPVVKKGSDIAFTFTQMNVPVQGHFEKFSGNICFDAAKPEASSVRMSVDTGSIRAGEDTDAEAVKPEWLNVKGFPQATFVSKNIKSLGGGRYEASGTFSLKGLSRDIVVPFTYKETAGGNAEASGEFSIKRGDYRIGEGEWSALDIVANEVRVRFHLILGATAGK
jgi:polyisoprenoid-binding protein YceI